MPRYFFFAIVFLLSIVIIPAHAEIERGINYDRELIAQKWDGSKTYKWTSTPYSADRILKDGTYKNYDLKQDSNNIYFESAHGKLSFNKSTCTMSVYDTKRIGETAKFLLSHTIKKAINGTDNWFESSENMQSCAYDIEQSDYSLRLVAHKGDFDVIYDIDFLKGFEWTYEYINKNIGDNDKKVGFTTVCDGAYCDEIKLNGQVPQNVFLSKAELSNKTITISSIPFDTKDEIHDALWAIKKQDNKLILDFTNAKEPISYNNTITIDPTFGYSAAQSQQSVITAATTQCYTQPGNTNNTAASTTSGIFIPSTGVADNCFAQLGKFIITSIPDGVTINSANFRYDRGAAGTSANERMFVARNTTLDPQGSATAAQKWVQMTQGNFIISPWTVPAAGTSNDVRAFNSNGTTAIANQLSANWFGLALVFVSMRSDGSVHSIQNMGGFELEVTYTLPPPNGVTTLTSSGTTTSTTNLSWSAPNLNGGTLQRYQIYYTTPCGTPATFLANGTTATSYAVTGLTPATCYSFRVSAATEAGYNYTGNIANVTTLTFNQANFTIGSFNFDADNPLRLPIRYERIDSGSNTRVNVTFANSITPACDLRYTYAGTNHTYHTVPTIPISSIEKEASFNIINSTNEIITFRCWNQVGNQSANYVLTQTDFLLLQQIEDFRNGTFGTMGQLGAFDLVALVIIIISMIGLNRTNEAVGGIFCIIAISVMAYFGIVSWVTAIVAAAAVILMLIVSSVKKD